MSYEMASLYNSYYCISHEFNQISENFKNMWMHVTKAVISQAKSHMVFMGENPLGPPGRSGVGEGVGGWKWLCLDKEGLPNLKCKVYEMKEM